MVLFALNVLRFNEGQIATKSNYINILITLLTSSSDVFSSSSVSLLPQRTFEDCWIVARALLWLVPRGLTGSAKLAVD